MAGLSGGQIVDQYIHSLHPVGVSSEGRWVRQPVSAYRAVGSRIISFFLINNWTGVDATGSAWPTEVFKVLLEDRATHLWMFPLKTVSNNSTVYQTEAADSEYCRGSFLLLLQFVITCQTCLTLTRWIFGSLAKVLNQGCSLFSFRLKPSTAATHLLHHLSWDATLVTPVFNFLLTSGSFCVSCLRPWASTGKVLLVSRSSSAQKGTTAWSCKVWVFVGQALELLLEFWMKNHVVRLWE